MTDLGSPDITDLILDEHAEFRRQFVSLWDLRPESDADGIAAAWQPLADLLEVHASAEEEILYPVLLRRGGDDATDETDDAIRDHNEIRDAIRHVGRTRAGSDEWWQAVVEANVANSDHMAEEERQDLTDFRQQVGLEERHEIAVQFLRYEAQNWARGVTPKDKDPKEYVEANESS